jgi:transketolase N-terminal domain/subunit
LLLLCAYLKSNFLSNEKNPLKVSETINKSTARIESLAKTASQVRRDIVRMVYNCQSGHPGGSLGCTDYFTALYFAVMKRKKRFYMDGKDEDMFFLSNGHISPVFYSTLARAGYFPVAELSTFRKLDSRLQGHPATHEGLPGVRIASGSLAFLWQMAWRWLRKKMVKKILCGH